MEPPASPPDGGIEDAIAVVGMACRFPGDAENIENFWEMIRDGKDAWSEIPSDRLNAKGWYHPDPNRPGSFHIRGAHFIKGDIAAFDAPFFSISTAEAVSMDPQQRMLLEVVYEAFDSAGIPTASLSNTATSVFCGSFVRDYEQPCMRDPDTTPPYSATGNGIAILANRISHAFDLAGTSQTIDTGCSASMIAVHQACKSLLSGESNIGIAAGVGLIFSPNTLVPMANLNILGADGRCYTFDERANGYGRGEGAGVLVLKRLKDALASNDTIRAVIRATASNQDGHTQGITLPSQDRQVQNISDIYRKSGLDITRTAYMECHGTGTQVGDVKETQAAAELFCKHRTAENPLIIGSVKTNIGHLEGSAGVAGLIKGILVVEQGFIPKHLNFKSPNKLIDLERMKLKIATNLTAWPVPGLRRASVNSFGFGGTNAHVVLDDVPHFLSERNIAHGHHVTHLFPGDKLNARVVKPSPTRTNNLFVFSGHDEAGLTRVLESQAKYVAKNTSTEGFEANYAYTLLSRRSRLSCRTFVVASSTKELLKKLENRCIASPTRPAQCNPNGLAYVFCGQGAQWHAMGRELLRYQVFYASISTASWYMSSILGSSFCLWDELHSRKDATRISDSQISQPATTAVQVALVDLLQSSGLVPTSVLGHSSGEIAAAYAAGAISREDAWRIAYYRGQSVSHLAQLASQRQRGMLAVALSEESALRGISDANTSSVEVACINGPASVTLSGDADEISRLHDHFQSQGYRAMRVNVDTAYHSRHMRPIENHYRKTLTDLEPPVLSPHKTKFFSSVFGKELSTTELGADYWVKNLMQPVQFYSAARDLMGCSCPAAFLEVSPHRVWESTLRQIFNSLRENISEVIPAEPSYASLLLRDQDASATALVALGSLWAKGFSFNLHWPLTSSKEGELPCHLVDVPSYPWDHSKRFWHESHLSKANRFRSHGREDIIGAPLENSTPQDPRWRGFFRVQENPWIEDHVIQRSIIYPAGGMIAMAIEAAKQLADHSRVILGFEVSNFKIVKPILIPTSTQDLENMMSARMVDEDDECYRVCENTYTFSIQSKPTDGPWIKHATGRLSVVYCKEGVHPSAEMERRFATTAQRQALQYVQKSCHTQLSPRQFYETLDVVGMTYGSQFRNLVEIERGDAVAHAVLEIPDTKAHMPFNFEFDHIIHPATLDTMLQTVMALGDNQVAMLPCSAGRVFVSARVPTGSGSRFRGYTMARRIESRDAMANITVFDDELCAPAVIFEDLLFKSVSPGTAPISGDFLPSNRNMCSEIVWKQDASSIAKLGFSLPTSIQEIVDLTAHKNPALSILYHVPSDPVIDCNIDMSDDRFQDLSSIAEAFRLKKLVLEILTRYETPRYSRCLVSGINSNKVLHHLHAIDRSSSGLDRVQHAETLAENDKFHIVLCSVDERDSTEALTECLSRVEEDGWFIVLSKIGGVINPAQHKAFKLFVQAAGFKAEKAAQNGTFLAAQRTSNKPQPCTSPTANCSSITILLPRKMSPFVRKLSTTIRALLESRLLYKVHETVFDTTSEDHRQVDGTFILSLVEIDSPLILEMGFELFTALQGLVKRAHGLLWLTQGGQVDCKRPDRAPFLGLARSLRSEDSKKRISTLDIDSNLYDSAVHDKKPNIPKTLVNSIVFLIWEQIKVMAIDKAQTYSGDVEFAYYNNRLMVPRLMPLGHLNRCIEQGSIVGREPLLSRGRAFKLDTVTVRSSEGPRFLDDSKVLCQQLDVNQVRIAVSGTHLLPEDVISFSRDTAHQIMGADVFGCVLETGRGVFDIPVGSCVVARMRGTLKTHVIVGAERVRRLDNPSNWQRSCPTAFSTAVYALHTSRRIMKGNFVLIYGSSSAYGQAAIRVALALGGTVIVACMTADERCIAQEQFRISPYHILDIGCGELEFEARLLALTQQSGVDVVFDPTSCHIEQALACVAECGRVIRVAQNGYGSLARAFADKNVSFETVDIDLLEARRPLEARRLFFDVDLMLQLFPGIDSVCCTLEYNMCDIQAALVQASATPFVGPRIVFTEADQGPNMVNTQIQLASGSELSPSATYLLVGGFGGLGRSIAEHLARRGARHIALFSRSGASSSSAQSLLAKMHAAGIDARAFTTDICDEQNLMASLKELQSVMPPIRGAIQCAAVVDDSAFPSMSYERWRRAFEPKVVGSNNLHKQLPRDMDFLVLLSSSSGVIGNRGQANYSAGNCFQDALARHRSALGMHSVSIDLGLVLGAGMVAENESLLDAMKTSGFIGIRIQDVLTVLDQAIARPGARSNMHVPAQIVTAVGTGGLTIQNQPSDPFWTRAALFRYLNQVDAPPHGLNSETRHAAGQDLQSVIRVSATMTEASQAVCTALIAIVARRKGMMPDDFDRHQPLGNYGIDSLDSMFLLGWISRETGVAVQTVEGVTIAELGRDIARRSLQALEEAR